jgi:hypothetical protein
MREFRPIELPQAPAKRVFTRLALPSFFSFTFTFLRRSTQRPRRVADETGMANKTKPTRSATPNHSILAKTAPAAFASILSEIEAVPASALRRNNLDMSRAARRGLAVAERLVPLLPELAELSKLDHHAVTSLRTRALAVLHADELVQEGGAAARTHLAVLLAEATPLRELMLSTAEVLAIAGYISRERVAVIRSGKGHVDMAVDVQALGRLYRELWPRVHDKVPVTREMVERAITLSAELQEALGIREIDEEEPLVEPAGPLHLRAQAFALFTQSYEECRRAVAYLRWHEGDAEVLVPSMYPRRGRNGAGTVDEAPDGEAEDDVAANEGGAAKEESSVGASGSGPARIVA